MSQLFFSRMLVIGMFIFAFAVVDRAVAQQADSPSDHVMLLPDGHEWVPAPASLPPGARVMIVEGNPAEEGEFTMRLWMPADYSISPHFHPADEHVTVISGSFYMGLGDAFDRDDAMRLPAGSFAMMRTGTTHFAFTTEETVVQLHGVGPWGLTYANAQDDPRNGTR